MSESGPIAIGVDVGGSGIKAAAIDTSRGTLVSERIRVPTPEPSVPAAVIASIFRIVRRVEQSIGASGLPVGIDFPSVILDGKTMTAANVDKQWIQYPAVEHIERAMGRPVSLINDADAAGLAEMRFGAAVGHRGVVLVLTLGTGVGSALFVDGVLVPNTELGHMEIRGRDAERRSAAAARVRRGLSWKAWTEDLDEHLIAIDRILWPDLIVLGGGVSKNADRFIPRLTCRPPVVPAVLRNEAGMVGAAMVAVERGATASAGTWVVPEPGPAEPGEDEEGGDATASAGGDATASEGGDDEDVGPWVDAERAAAEVRAEANESEVEGEAESAAMDEGAEADAIDGGDEAQAESEAVDEGAEAEAIDEDEPLRAGRVLEAEAGAEADGAEAEPVVAEPDAEPVEVEAVGPDASEDAGTVGVGAIETPTVVDVEIVPHDPPVFEEAEMTDQPDEAGAVVDGEAIGRPDAAEPPSED